MGTLSGGRAGRAGGESEFSSEVVWERKGLAFKNMSSLFDGSAEKPVLLLVSSPIERISSGKSIMMRGFHTEWMEAPGYPSSRNCKRIPLAGPCSFLAHPPISSTVASSPLHPSPSHIFTLTLLPWRRRPCPAAGLLLVFPILPAINTEPPGVPPLPPEHRHRAADAPLSQPPSVCRRERIYLHQRPIIRGNL